MSNINPSSINITFPVAGQDNNSQGFRDNFANTATNFTYAASEITDLQNKAILKSALTGSSLNNNMQGALLTNAVIAGFSDLLLDLGSVSGAVAINASTASVQRITTSGSVTISLTGFPSAGNYGKLRLEVVVTNTSYTLTIPSTVTLNTTGILGLSGQIITFPSVGTYWYEFSTFDGSGSFLILDLVNNRTSITGNQSITGNLSVAGSITSTSSSAALIVNANVTPIASQAAAIAGSTIRAVQVDGTATRVLIDSYVNAGNPSPGVSVRGARGTALVPTAIQSTDIIGSFTAHGYGTTGFSASSTGMLAMVSEGTFTDASQATAISFQVTPSGSITKAEKMRLSSAGVLTVTGGVASTSTTTGTVVVTGGIGASGSICSGGYFVENVLTVTSAHPFSATDSTVIANVTTASFTVTLPNAVGNAGRICKVIKGDTSGNIVTIASGGGTLNGISALQGVSYSVFPNAATTLMRVTYISDGTNWWQTGY